MLKEPRPIAPDFFQTFRDLGIRLKKAHIFLITPCKFYAWKMYCVEDMNENMTSYGNRVLFIDLFWLSNFELMYLLSYKI